MFKTQPLYTSRLTQLNLFTAPANRKARRRTSRRLRLCAHGTTRGPLLLGSGRVC